MPGLSSVGCRFLRLLSFDPHFQEDPSSSYNYVFIEAVEKPRFLEERERGGGAKKSIKKN